MIVGIKENDRVVLGWSDWILPEVNDKDKVLKDNLPFKVVKEKGIVVCSYWRLPDTDIFFADEKLMKEITKDEVTYERMINDVVPLLEKIATENDLFDEDGKLNNCFTVAQTDKLYDVMSTEYVRDVTDFFVHGSSVDYMKGSLAYSRGRPAEERIEEGFRFHAKMMNERVFPIVLINTKTLCPQVITE